MIRRLLTFTFRALFCSAIITPLYAATSVEELAADPEAGPEQTTAAIDQEAREVQRLKQLLTRYYREEERAEMMGAIVVTPVNAKRPDAPSEYSAEQVLLSGGESISAIRDIDARLDSDSTVTAQRRDIDVIYHIEVRREGSLVSSKSHSLKALGRAQFMSQINLGAGDVEITIKSNSWSAKLTEENGSDYLITLSTPFDRPPELHLISLQALHDTGWEDLPAWLPAMGTSQGT